MLFLADGMSHEEQVTMLFKDCGVEGSEDRLEKDQLKAYY